MYYLADPATDSNTLSVDFGADILPTAGNGAWEIGAVSLSGVDEADPIAGVLSTSSNNDPLIMESGTPGAITAGDFLLLSAGNDGSTGTPTYTVPTGSQTILYDNNSPTGTSGGRSYDAIHATLAAGDLSGDNGDEVVLGAETRTRNGAHTGVVFNAIPEPASLSLLASGGLLLLPRRRREGRACGS
ncbi:MAG: hypothetical protein WD534_01760 [Phycisphaeraceae bacterium]